MNYISINNKQNRPWWSVFCLLSFLVGLLIVISAIIGSQAGFLKFFVSNTQELSDKILQFILNRLNAPLAITVDTLVATVFSLC